MRATDTLLKAIKHFEGTGPGYKNGVFKAYVCPSGHWTIGYGHTGAEVTEGKTINETKANELLCDDLETFETQIDKLGIPELNAHQYDAILDFVYNCGIDNLKKSTLLRKLKANPKDETIANEFGRWVYGKVRKKNPKTGKTEVKNIVLPGLVERRAWESKRWEGKV